MAGNRFAEIDLAFFPCFFYTTLYNTKLISNTIYANAAVYGRGYITILVVYSVGSLLFYFRYIFRVEGGFILG